MQDDLGVVVTMQEVINRLEQFGVEGVKLPTDYGCLLEQFEFSGWYETWDCSLEPFMELSGIEALEKVPEYGGLKKHPAWEDLKKRVSQGKWGVVE